MQWFSFSKHKTSFAQCLNQNYQIVIGKMLLQDTFKKGFIHKVYNALKFKS